MSKTKKSLVLSCLSMLLCMTMLIGSTFAWFADNATTGVNTIQAGTLDIGLYEFKGVYNPNKLDEYTNLEKEKLTFRDKKGKTNILWEPGATFMTQEFIIVNQGDLASKMEIVINGFDAHKSLLEAIDFTFEACAYGDPADSNALWMPLSQLMYKGEFTLDPGQASSVMRVSAKMKESAGNEYMGQTLEGIGITVYATQAPKEYDSYGNEYDENAPINKNAKLVSTAEELQDAFNSLGKSRAAEPELIILTNDIDMNGKNLTAVQNVSFTLDGAGHTISNLRNNTQRALFVDHSGTGVYEFKNLTLKDCVVDYPNNTDDDSVNTGVALFIGMSDTCNNARFTNVTVDNCTVEGGHWTGALVGFAAGYGTITDGPAFGNFIVKDCVVKNTSVTSNHASVGAVVGHATANEATEFDISNVTIENVKLYGDDGKTGLVVGTSGNGDVTIKDIRVLGTNEGKFTNAHPYYGRTAFAGTGSLVIEEENISE